MEIQVGPSFPPPRPLPTRPAPPPPPPPAPDPEALSAQEHDDLSHAVNLSALVYDDGRHVKPELRRMGYAQEAFFCSFVSGAQACAGLVGEVAYIAFRGSSGPMDWVVNFAMLPAFWPPRHEGFETALRTLLPPLEAWLEAARPAALVLTGHSLGGALAHLAAWRFAARLPVRGVFTFGAPKAWFLGSARHYDRTPVHPRATRTLGEVTRCAIHQRDIVARVPFGFLGYRDVGRLVYIDVDDEVYIGAAARRKRELDSMKDADFVFKFIDTESVAMWGLRPAPKTPLEHVRHWLNRACEWSPYLRTPVFLAALYVLSASYLLRSGLAHMYANYESVLRPAFARRPVRQRFGWLRSGLAALPGLVLALLALALFLYGLFRLVRAFLPE